MLRCVEVASITSLSPRFYHLFKCSCGPRCDVMVFCGLLSSHRVKQTPNLNSAARRAFHEIITDAPMKMLSSHCTARGPDFTSHPFHPITRRIPILSCARLRVFFLSLIFFCRARAACAPASTQRGSALRANGYLRRSSDGLDNNLVERREGDGSYQRGGK